MRRHSRQYCTNADPQDVLDAKTRLTIKWSNLTCLMKPTRSIIDKLRRKEKLDPVKVLSNCSGEAWPGQLVAVVGPSGAGKTILLEILGGNLEEATLTGDILVNGVKRTKDYLFVAAYVGTWTDTLDPLMSVRETMEFSAKLTLPQRYSEEEKQERIDLILDALGLTRCAEGIIGEVGSGQGISHGERKRLSIALR